MENICANTRRGQCNDFKRGPQFGLWMWCIVIKCLVSLPCIFSRCHGVDISVSLQPENMINIFYGDPLEIFCIADSGTAHDLFFFLGDQSLESEIVNSTTRRLFFERPEKQVNTYYCRNNATKKQCTTRVLVDLPPSNVTDFSCISRNIEELNCSWTGKHMLSKRNYSLTYIVNNSFAKPCNAIKSGNMWFCLWNTTSQPRYRQLDNSFLFQLTGCNYFGCNQQSFTINHFANVKPDPPLYLKVISNNPHSVLLKWDIPNNMVDFLPCPIVHKIEYQISKIEIFHSVDVTHLSPKNKTYKFLLSNLPYAHTSYEVRIFIKSAEDIDNKFWSNFSYIIFTTASEKPQRPPDTIAGAFHQAIYASKRVIYVYWQQLDEYEEAGENFTYKVVTKQGNKNPETSYPDKNKSLSYVTLNDASLEAIDVSIWSSNANGSSANSSHLYIPSKHDTEALSVSSFTKLAYENGTYKLSWVAVQNIDNYTLFWCQHNSTQVCVGRLNFTVLNPKKIDHVINLPRENRYQFAISANNGSKTGGMSWASCDISKDAIPMYGFPLKLNHGAPGKSFVKLTWTMSCTLQENIITGYLITYCPGLDTSNVCDTRFENISMVYINNSKQMETNITNLKPYRTYLFTLALNTTYGLKTIENATTSVTTTEDTPTSPTNVKLFDIQYNSLNISWDPPHHKNGIIGKYVIRNAGKEIHVVTDKDKDFTRRLVKITGLMPFTNYSLSLEACNTAIGLCSSPSDAIFVRTRIGPPSILNPPLVKINLSLLEWQPPVIPGGTLDLYQIKRIKDDNIDTIEYFNTTNLSFSITHCERVESSESYQVRAINFDEDEYHGVVADKEVFVPRNTEGGIIEFSGEWSSPSIVTCRKEGITMTLILMSIFILIGATYGSIKIYKKVRKMEDIKPVLPNGLGIPEKDISKYAYGGLYSTNKDEKPSSDEMLLLPNSRITVSNPESKQNNCGSSDHTDSTALSDMSQDHVDRRTSTSDDGSDSSLHLEVEPVKLTNSNEVTQEDDESSNSQGNSPYFSDKSLNKNSSGYVQPLANSNTGYVQSAPTPKAQPAPQLASSSYVMAALSPPIFTTGVAHPIIPSQPPASSGYMRPEDVQARSKMNFPKLGPSPTKAFGSESLPAMPNLPQPTKHSADNSYIQLQSLDALTSHKHPVRNPVPLKAPTSSGYVSPGDAVINKHLNNMLSGAQLTEESAILDPAMSPDAYCRFSWSTDPVNDNLHSLLADSHTLNSSKNGI